MTESTPVSRELVAKIADALSVNSSCLGASSGFCTEHGHPMAAKRVCTWVLIEAQAVYDYVHGDFAAAALTEAANALLTDKTAEPGTMKHIHHKIYAAWLVERAEQKKEGKL